MTFVLALTHQTGRRLANRLLIFLFAGIWLVAAQIPQLKMPTAPGLQGIPRLRDLRARGAPVASRESWLEWGSDAPTGRGRARPGSERSCGEERGPRTSLAPLVRA